MSEISPFTDAATERTVVQSNNEDDTNGFTDEEMFKNGGILLHRL